MSYKEIHTFKERLEESSKMLIKYPDRIPIICEINIDNNIKTNQTVKYLVPNDITVGQLSYIIRKRFKINSNKAMYLLVGDKIVPPTSVTVRSLYDKHKAKCNFLFVNVAFESFFG